MAVDAAAWSRTAPTIWLKTFCYSVLELETEQCSSLQIDSRGRSLHTFVAKMSKSSCTTRTQSLEEKAVAISER